MTAATEDFRARIKALGFDEVRFARVEPQEKAVSALDRWLQSGAQADMAWIQRGAEKRRDPNLILPGVRSVILLGINYGSTERPRQNPVWARYSLYEDYHDTLRGALIAAGKEVEQSFGVPATAYRYYVDTGPVLERAWAERAGLGFIGKNAMLISRHFGNWLFLAEILTTVELEPDPPLGSASSAAGEASERMRVGLYCGSCTRCMDACPTGAIKGPGFVDARLCISYQTIENKGVIPRELRRGIGNRIYGCDVCLEVCPWNRFAQESRSVLLTARDEIRETSLKEILSMDAEVFARVFRKTPMKRTKLGGILRNACIVAGNTRAVECLERLVELAADGIPLVRAHAVWAVYRIADQSRARELLASARARERDSAVLDEYAAEERTLLS